MKTRISKTKTKQNEGITKLLHTNNKGRRKQQQQIGNKQKQIMKTKRCKWKAKHKKETKKDKRRKHNSKTKQTTKHSHEAKITHNNKNKLQNATWKQMKTPTYINMKDEGGSNNAATKTKLEAKPNIQRKTKTKQTYNYAK